MYVKTKSWIYMFAGHFDHYFFFWKWKHISVIIVLISLDPDCYQIVYDNRKKDCTTYLPHEKTTFKKSKDVEDNR